MWIDASQFLIQDLFFTRPDTLDPALLRPGRLDRRVEFGLPDNEGRAHILRIHARSMSVERDIRFDLIARLCPNTTGAELRSVATEVSWKFCVIYIEDFLLYWVHHTMYRRVCLPFEPEEKWLQKRIFCKLLKRLSERVASLVPLLCMQTTTRAISHVSFRHRFHRRQVYSLLQIWSFPCVFAC